LLVAEQEKYLVALPMPFVAESPAAPASVEAVLRR
jgi:hypothetical protein